MNARKGLEVDEQRPASQQVEIEASGLCTSRFRVRLGMQLRVENPDSDADQGRAHVDGFGPRGGRIGDVAGEQILALQAQRDVVGDEILDAAADAAGGVNSGFASRPVDLGARVVRLCDREPCPADQVGDQAIVEQRIAQARLGNEPQHLELAEILDLHVIGVERQLDTQIAVEVSGDRRLRPRRAPWSTPTPRLRSGSPGSTAPGRCPRRSSAPPRERNRGAAPAPTRTVARPQCRDDPDATKLDAHRESPGCWNASQRAKAEAGQEDKRAI